MEKKIYVIHDELKGEWDSDEIMLQNNDTLALRAFGDIIEQKTYIWKHEKDYNLYRLGYMDAEIGLIAEEPKLVAKAEDIKKIIEMKEEKDNAEKALKSIGN